MKMHSFIAVLCALIASLSIVVASREEAMTAYDSSASATEAVVVPFLVSVDHDTHESAQKTVPDDPPAAAFASKLRLSQIAADAAARRGATLQIVPSAKLRLLRATSNAATAVKNSQDRHKLKNDNHHEIFAAQQQNRRHLRTNLVELNAKVDKFFDKTLDEFNDGDRDRPPVFRQFSMPILGLGPFGLALGRPRGGRFRKDGGGDEDRRRTTEIMERNTGVAHRHRKMNA